MKYWEVYMETNEALARFLVEVATAAEQLAAELRGAQNAVVDGGRSLGKRQIQAMAAVRRAERDMSTREISDAMHYDFSNTYMTMRRLAQLGLVRLVPGSRPQRWRLEVEPSSN
jgi:hypothetical protein